MWNDDDGTMFMMRMMPLIQGFVFLFKTNILMSLYFLRDMLQMSGSGRRLE